MVALVEIDYPIVKGLQHLETLEGQKTLTGCTVHDQISEAATMLLGCLQSFEAHQGRAFGTGFGALATVMGLGTESSPM